MASNILYRTLNDNKNQEVTYTFKDIRYDATDGIGIKMKVSVYDPVNPTLTGMLELLVIIYYLI